MLVKKTVFILLSGVLLMGSFISSYVFAKGSLGREKTIEEVFKEKVEISKQRAKDYSDRKKRKLQYQKEVNSSLNDFLEIRKKREEKTELNRKLYAEQRVSQKTDDRDLFFEAEGEKLKAIRDQKFKQLQEKYSKRKSTLKKMLEQTERLIPEDEELGLDYSTIK